MQAGLVWPSKGLVIVTGVAPVTEDLADVAVGPLFPFGAVVGGVGRRVGHLRLCRAVLRVVEVEAVADVTEKPRGKLLLCRFLVMAAKKKRIKRAAVECSCSCSYLSRNGLIIGLTHHSYPVHWDYFHSGLPLPFSPIYP